MFCSNSHKCQDYCYLSYHCQRYITKTDLYYHIFEIQFPNLFFMVTQLNLRLYKIVKIYFAQVKLYPLFQNWKGGGAGRFSAASMVLPSRTQLGSREGKGGYPWLMVGIFFFFNVSCTRASGWVSLLVDCLGRYHSPSREILRSLTQTGVRSVRIELP